MRDTGIGIEQADLELIFQEFGQVAHRLQSRVKGTGLGLPLSKKLAELLGGGIAVESTPGKGSTFSVTLPRSYPQVMEQADDAEEPWSLEPGRVPVLVVEDDPADTFALQAHSGGYAVSAALHALDTAGPADSASRFIRRRSCSTSCSSGDESWRLLLQLRQQERICGHPAGRHVLVRRGAQGNPSRAPTSIIAKPVDGDDADRTA